MTFPFQKTLTILTALVSLACSSALHAQEELVPERPLSKYWIFNLSLESVSIDKEAARLEGVGSTAWYIGFDGEYFVAPDWSTSIGLAVLGYSDKRSFSQRTEDQFGNTDDSDSAARAFPLYAEFGYKNFLGKDNQTYLTARAGISTLLSSDRSIGNCSNCYEEDIDIKSGLYGLFGAGIHITPTVAMGLQYKHYLSGDLENSLGLSFTFGL